MYHPSAWARTGPPPLLCRRQVVNRRQAYDESNAESLPESRRITSHRYSPADERPRSPALSSVRCSVWFGAAPSCLQELLDFFGQVWWLSTVQHGMAIRAHRPKIPDRINLVIGSKTGQG